MILINRMLLIILAVIVISASLAAGLFGYSQIIDSEGVVVDEIRFQAERFLFLSIVITVILAAGFTALLLRVRHVDRKLDRLIEMSRYSDIYPNKHFVGLGPLGERLKLIYSHINRLNIQKTIKISAMASLNEFLMNNITLPLLITDVTGTILYSSAGFADKSNHLKGELKRSRIDSVFTDINLPTLMLEMSRQHVPVERESNRSHITCYPVHNVSGELNYIAFVPDKKAAFVDTHKSGIDVIRRGSTIAARMGKLLSRRND